ncbi:hypothetical protein QBA36_41905, partial [Streptomyces stelliscabiei]
PSRSPPRPPLTRKPSAKTSAPSAQAAADSTDDDGGSPAVPLAIGAAVVLALGGGVWWLRSRKGGTA